MQYSTGSFGNYKLQFWRSSQNSWVIPWSRPVLDSWLIRKFRSAHIVMMQQFRSSLHRNWKKVNYFISIILKPTYIWQLLRSFLLKHIKAFSSGTSKVLQDPLSKSNGKSDCLTISHPTTLAALTIVCLWNHDFQCYLSFIWCVPQIPKLTS